MSKMDYNNELMILYITECEQMIQKFQKIILDSDENGKLTDPSEIFRLLHTLKGSSSMMELNPLVEVIHNFENIFSAIKNEKIQLNKSQLDNLIDIGLEFAEYYKKQLLLLHEGKKCKANKKLLEQINSMNISVDINGDDTTHLEKEIYVEEQLIKGGELSVRVMLKACPLPHIRAFIIAKSISKFCSSIETLPKNIDKASKYADSILREGFQIIFVPNNSFSLSDIIEKINTQPYVSSCYALEKQNKQMEKSEEKINIDILQNITAPQSVINSLIDYLDEISTAETVIEAYLKEINLKSRRMDELLANLRGVIADANIMATEIGSHGVGSVFIQVQRTVRSMAKDLGKQVNVKTSGSEIQVDKSILEILSDSMIHIVRNAVDHGIEYPEKRTALGKSQAGVIELTAIKTNNYLQITVSDDGAGINKEKVLDIAEKNGKLFKPKKLYEDSEVCQLLLESGVSTNEKVTRYSGRGVGLDTVVRRVRQAGGRVTMESRQGKGSLITLLIPLSLLIIEGIEVSLSDESSIIVPTSGIQHILAINKNDKSFTLLEDGSIKYKGEQYSELVFPGIKNIESGYAIILYGDYGKYYFKVEKVSMMLTYFIKKMPKYVIDSLGESYIFSGCALCTDYKLKCVLDLGKFVHLSTGK